MDDSVPKRRSRIAALLLVSSGFCGVPAAAQEADADDAAEEIEEIIVTGSRIARDSFSSPSPIQVLDVEENRRIGVSSIPELVARSPVVNGRQIDATLNTAAGNSNATEEPPPGGVGSTNISLRGVGPERTLILVNGRRLGSTGVRGAPTQPDVNMIPFDMIDRVEILTEGVSAVYGADAVAGVVNVILRDQVEGIQLRAHASRPFDDGGEITQFSLTAGANTDRARFTFGAEFFDRQRIRTGDRSASQCLRYLAETESGERLSLCSNNYPDNSVILLDPDTLGFAGVAWRTPDGSTDIGVPGFGTFQLAIPPPPDPALASGLFQNFRYQDEWNDQDERRASDLVGELQRFSAIATGEVDLGWWRDEQVYFESFYMNSQVFSRAALEQIGPDIGGEIAQEDANGNLVVNADGSLALVPNPLNPFGIPVQPIVTLESVPQTRDVEREQIRLVAGFRGGIGDSTWHYDGFVSYDRGIGFQAQPILFENHLLLATQTLRLDSAGNLVCGARNTTTTPGLFITPEPCVPLNLFHENIYTGGPNGEGVLSDEEINYLVGLRTNRTVVEQTMFSAFATGDLFDIGDRAVATAIGIEYRKDAVDSQNDITGVLGLNAAENPLQEGQTIGERDLIEIFGEISVPVTDQLLVDAALRYTDEENFGSETTWRARASWTPLDYLTISASAGTSFRAPNLREQFLAGQGGGVGAGLDPCNNGGIQLTILEKGQADPDLQFLIANCVAQGVTFEDTDGDGNLDTTDLLSIATIPTISGGNENVSAETSDSKTATIQFSQPWTDSFELDVAVSYWDLVINDTLSELDAGSIISQCYTNRSYEVGTSPFCDRQTRRILPNGAVGAINRIDISFVNIGEQTAKGIDLNTRLTYHLDRWNMDLNWSTALSRQLEQEIQIVGPDDRDDNVGEIGTPKIRFTNSVSLVRGDWEVLMQNRYISSAMQDNVPDFAPDPRWVDQRLTRPIAHIDPLWYTDLSVTWAHESWSATLGMQNLFDEDPPLISRGWGPQRNNAVTSSGYDLFGRTMFVMASAHF